MAQQLGITKYHAALLPEHKVQLANNLGEKYGSMVMVGDGVNDAPVLASSNVGIAIGTAGNDIAIEAADIALMGSDLKAVPYVIKLGRKVVGKLKINIALTLSFKFFMIALGALGLIPLWFAVIGDDGITLVVIANALPLLRFKR
ncbi:HAD-IC family P-type ATPase [Candidatus Bathyarchaeota archaeon]|nr:HAD-IC family P-type ATPase [Candidatus Bathyarchaeota archaeon]MBS7631343.1 HAD-IC family P-type ATPase [Candidatus Bathyarchaeota archaeon]